MNLLANLPWYFFVLAICAALALAELILRRKREKNRKHFSNIVEFYKNYKSLSAIEILNKFEMLHREGGIFVRNPDINNKFIDVIRYVPDKLPVNCTNRNEVVAAYSGMLYWKSLRFLVDPVVLDARFELVSFIVQRGGYTCLRAFRSYRKHLEEQIKIYELKARVGNKVEQKNAEKILEKVDREWKTIADFMHDIRG